MKFHRLHMAVLAISLWPANAMAEDQTVGGLFRDGTSLVQTAARLSVILAGLIGIALVAWCIFKLATERDDQQRWRYFAAGTVGSLFTIYGVIVGAFSSLFG